MVKKSKWFSNVKKAFSPHSKKGQKSKKQLRDLDSSNHVENVVVPSSPPLVLPPQPEDVKIVTSNEPNVVPYSVPVATAPAPEPEVSSIQTTVEVVRIARPNRFVGKSNEEVAVIKIQTAFRGYMARRALRALRGLVRLKSLMEGPTIKRQAAHTLKCMQALSRVQSQIHSRRMRMAEENQALQKQLLQKHAKELENLRIGEEWDDSLQSKEQIEANLLSKYEAAMRRERAMAYAFTHQKTWKNSPKSASPMFMNPANPAWGWSWMERWMAAHPWESRGSTDKELNNSNSSTKIASRSTVGEISKSYARYQLNTDKLTPVDSEKRSPNVNQQSPSSPLKSVSSAAARKLKSASPRSSFGAPDDDARANTDKLTSVNIEKRSPNVNRQPSSSPLKSVSSAAARKLKSASPRNTFGAPDDDARSMTSIQSHRRHSIPGSMRDDESPNVNQQSPFGPLKSVSSAADRKLKSASPRNSYGAPDDDARSMTSIQSHRRLSIPGSMRNNESPNVIQQSPSSPLKSVSSAAARKLKSASPRNSFGAPDDDAGSMTSIQSHRRHSIPGSMRDDESLGSSPSLPSYMVPTESARAKSRLQSPLAAEKNGTPEREKASLGTAKKRLSYPASPARPRRHSSPPRVETNFNAESNSVINGE